MLSRHCAGIVSRNRLDPDESLTIRFRGGSTEAAVRLVGELGQHTDGYVYDVAFVDSELDFGELKFPPPPWRADVDVALECGVCQTPELVDQCEVETDVYALAGWMVRVLSAVWNLYPMAPGQRSYGNPILCEPSGETGAFTNQATR